MPELKGGLTSGLFRFGAGEMRVFARTARPIGGVQVQTPVVARDFTLEAAPISVSIDATLADAAGAKLAGAVPMQIRVIDPLGGVRYDLYRATTMGTLQLSLPLAANDPPGEWTVTVKELLDNHAGSARFSYRPATQCGALAGATRRAVFFGNDRENIFRFIRTQQDVTIVKGTRRLLWPRRRAAGGDPQAVGRPLDHRRGRRGEQAAPLDGRRGEDLGRPGIRPRRAGRRQPPGQSRLRAGRPGDPAGHARPITRSSRRSARWASCPMRPARTSRAGDAATWPGSATPSACQQESVTLVAADAEGMAEAVGSLYEAAAGIDPMTRWALPAASAVSPATANLQPPEAAARWQAVLPDRVLSLAVGPAGDITAISLDGSATVLDKAGKVVSQRAVSPAEIAAAKKAAAVKPVVPAALTAKLAPHRVPKFVVTSAGLTAVAYWGGTLQVFAADGTLNTQQLQPQDISALAWAGNTLIVGQSDGCVVSLEASVTPDKR